MQDSKQDPLQKAVQEVSQKMSELHSRKESKDFDLEKLNELADEARKTFDDEDLTRFCI